MNERNEKIKAVFSDEDFVKTCLEAENEEAVQKLLADKGVEMSLDEISAVGDTIRKYAEGKVSVEEIEKLRDGELDDAELEQVAGGDLICAAIVGVVLLGGGLITTEGIMQACGTSLKKVFNRW